MRNKILKFFPVIRSYPPYPLKCARFNDELYFSAESLNQMLRHFSYEELANDLQRQFPTNIVKMPESK